MSAKAPSRLAGILMGSAAMAQHAAFLMAMSMFTWG